MSGVLPTDVRNRLRQMIWKKADDLQWSSMSDTDRASWYEMWSKDREVGQVLAHYMDPRKVRVYLKDSLLKPYGRARLAGDLKKVMAYLEINESTTTFLREYHKPHGRMLSDGRVICWGNSRDWKSLLISVFERAYLEPGALAYGAVFLEAGRTTSEFSRQMILTAGVALGLSQVVWVEE